MAVPAWRRNISPSPRMREASGSCETRADEVVQRCGSRQGRFRRCRPGFSARPAAGCSRETRRTRAAFPEKPAPLRREEHRAEPARVVEMQVPATLGCFYDELAAIFEADEPNGPAGDERSTNSITASGSSSTGTPSPRSASATASDRQQQPHQQHQNRLRSSATRGSAVGRRPL
jgi:hypothetical protein